MSIKRKLLVVLIIMGTVLGVIAGFVAWNAARIVALTGHIRDGMDQVQLVGRIRAHYFRQAHSSAHFVAFGDEESRTEFDKLTRDIEEYFKALSPAALENMGRGYLSELKGEFGRITEESLSAFNRKRQGRTREAAQAIDDRVEPVAEAFLLRLDDLLQVQVRQIHNDLDRILMRLGAVPGTSEERLRLIESARASLKYYVVMDRLSMQINSQVKEILDYLIIGTESSRREYLDFQDEVNRTLAEIDAAFRIQKVLPLEGEEMHLSMLRTVKYSFQNIVKELDDIAAKGTAGDTAGAFALLETKASFMIDNIMLSTIDAILHDGRDEIASASERLTSSALRAGAVSTAVLAVLCVGLFWGTLRVMRGMIVRIRDLKVATEAIAAGDLERRIAVRANDELGGLAASFNRMTAALQETNEDLRSFIYSLSHDIRTPLVNIKGFSRELRQMLLELGGMVNKGPARAEDAGTERTRDLLEREIPATAQILEGAADRINELANGVLKLSQVGQMKLRPERIDMTELVRSGIKRFEKEIDARKIAIRVQDLPAVTADRAAMSEIVGNILDNAVKYLQPDRPGIIEISGATNNGDMRMMVKDNGRGIAEHDLEKIFGLFRRSGEQDVPGSGMGLAFVRALVRRHGGAVRCESRAGVGTTITVSIPQLPAPFHGVSGTGPPDFERQD